MADTAGYYRDRAPTAVGTITNTVVRPTGSDRSSWVSQYIRNSVLGSIYLVVKKYLMRAWDSGSGGRYVIWTSNETPNTSPQSSETTPNYTGTLSAIRIERIS